MEPHLKGNRPMKTFAIWISLAALLTGTQAAAGSWENSPNNWANSPNNWANSPNNWANSPNNWANNPANQYGGNRVYGNDGAAQGYAVPRGDGGTNYFDFNGNRRGYSR
jgi:hypothetical protein